MRLTLFFLTVFASSAAAELQVLDDQLHHLRFGEREWSEFAEKPEGERLQIAFQSKANATEQTLFVRQQDVKQQWLVTINGKPVGKLKNDENDMIQGFAIPPGGLVDGENRLVIEQDRLRNRKPDDIRVGGIRLDSRPLSESLSDARLMIKVIDADSGEPLPARITILNADGALQKIGGESNDHLAVRAGIVFTGNGSAEFGLPTGEFEIIAGRGFEYSIDRAPIKIEPGKNQEATLKIRRVVDTAGYVACDTHVHTLTHSGHGDATVQERMITLAAEGIELPIATDHNKHIDHESFAKEMGVRQYFTPVIGNEFTTKVGHFNIWPIDSADVPPPDWKTADWEEIFVRIYQTPGVRAVILNHGRDVHGGTTPLGPKLHNAVAGRNLEGWVLRANAMETINSGATQTDVLELLHDWMALLNRGFNITPVGSSDSHDVARHFVGQGRTYIRVDDSDPGAIDVSAAAGAFVSGKVIMSYGLFVELEVNGKRSGEIAGVKPGEEFEAKVRVSGPEWTAADELRIYLNGTLTETKKIDAFGEYTFKFQAAKHDQFITAIATGPGIDSLHWPTAKAYQPDSIDWNPRVAACSGALWLNVDGSGQKQSAADYALSVPVGAGSFEMVLARLKDYDSAVAVQVASNTYGSKDWPTGAQLKAAPPHVSAAFAEFLAYQQKCEAARAEVE
ncbi:MAG: hypothetical protein ACI8UO_001792 [Verrucomicrobiales bacterium]|jgi:hypothetical protein